MSVLDNIVQVATALGSTAGIVAFARQLRQDHESRKAKLQLEMTEGFPTYRVGIAYAPKSLHTAYVADAKVLRSTSVMLLRTHLVLEPAYPHVREAIESFDGSSQVQVHLSAKPETSPTLLVGSFVALGSVPGELVKIRVIVREVTTGRAVARDVRPFKTPVVRAAG